MLKGIDYLMLTHECLIDEQSPQHLGSSYHFPSFELTSPANDCYVEEQCNEVLLWFYHFLIGFKEELGPLFKGLNYLWPVLQI